MGTPKAELDLAGSPLFSWAAAALQGAPVRVQSGGDPLPGLGWRVIPDDPPGAGPAGALATLLENLRCPLVCCPVDMPFAGATLLGHLARLAAGAASHGEVAAVVPHHGGRWHPLAAAWLPAALPALRSRLARGARDLQGLLAEIPVRELTGDDLSAFGDPSVLLANLNTPEHLAWARRRAATG